MAQPRAAASGDRDQVMKARIISHMNADHVESMKLYLQNYCGIPAGGQLGSPELTDITLDHMIIKSNTGRNLIHFHPPMTSFAEARERMVAMHNQSLNALGLSDITVNEFVLPYKAWHWALTLLCLWCYCTLPFPEKISPESSSFMSYAWSLGGRLPALSQLAAYLAPIVLPAMLLIHAGEATYLWWSRLRKHKVSLASKAAWLWIGIAVFAGFVAFDRFDELVEEKKSARQGKH